MIRALRILWFTALFVTIATLVIHCGAPTPPPPPPTTTTQPGPPVTTVPTPPPPEVCRFLPADVDHYKITVKQNGSGQALDVTPTVCGKSVAPCNHPTGPGLCCALSAEAGNQACADALYSAPPGPHWSPDKTVKIGPLAYGQGADGYTQKISEGDGMVSIFGSIALGTKAGSGVRLHVKKASPACDADAAGVCTLSWVTQK